MVKFSLSQANLEIPKSPWDYSELAWHYVGRISPVHEFVTHEMNAYYLALARIKPPSLSFYTVKDYIISAWILVTKLQWLLSFAALYMYSMEGRRPDLQTSAFPVPVVELVLFMNLSARCTCEFSSSMTSTASRCSLLCKYIWISRGKPAVLQWWLLEIYLPYCENRQKVFLTSVLFSVWSLRQKYLCRFYNLQSTKIVSSLS